jgi:hypothetical protein
LFNDGARIFQGNLDKDNIEIDPIDSNISLSINGIEQDLSRKLSEYDISQLYYYLDGYTPVRQRGGRTGEVRFDSTLYNNMADMIIAMFKDSGFLEENILTSFWSSDKFKYCYNSEKFGDISQTRPVSKFRNYSDRSTIADLSTRKVIPFYKDDENSDSYNTLIKDFATLTGCIYFVDYQTGKVLFMNRQHDFRVWSGEKEGLTDRYVDLRSSTLNYKMPIKCKTMYDGIILRFSDISFMLKLKNTDILTEDDYEIGIDGDYTVSFFDPYYYVTLPYGEYRLGTVPLTNSLQCQNALKLEFDSQLKDYVTTGVLGRMLEDFILDIFLNYKDILFNNRELTFTVDGLYFAPLNVHSVFGGLRNIFYTETDFNKEETKMKIEWRQQ